MGGLLGGWKGGGSCVVGAEWGEEGGGEEISGPLVRMATVSLGLPVTALAQLELNTKARTPRPCCL